MRPTLDASAVGDSVDNMRRRWDAPDGSASVSFTCEDVDRLRGLTIDAFLSLPKRGVEIGGFLLGKIESADPLMISIEGFEPVPCEHKYGPSYVLSEADRGHFTKVLDRLNRRGFPIRAPWDRRERSCGSRHGPVIFLIPADRRRCGLNRAWSRFPCPRRAPQE